MTHPRLHTAARLISKVEALTGVRIQGRRTNWRFEQIRADLFAREQGEWRWRLVNTEDAFGLEIGSTHRVNEVLSAYRLLVVVDAGKVDVLVEMLGGERVAKFAA